MGDRALLELPAGPFDVGALQADHDENFQTDLPGHGNLGLGDGVARNHPVEDVSQDAPDLGVGKNDSEAFGGLVGCDRSTNV